MKRLGILEFEPSIGTYGELIPGMLAGRWDFVTAALAHGFELVGREPGENEFGDRFLFAGRARNTGELAAELAPVHCDRSAPRPFVPPACLAPFALPEIHPRRRVQIEKWPIAVLRVQENPYPAAALYLSHDEAVVSAEMVKRL